MAARIYVNTFGAKGERSFSTVEDYHFQVMQALTERGYIPVEGGVLAKGESWVGEDGGFVVHAKLKKGGKAVFFMSAPVCAAVGTNRCRRAGTSDTATRRTGTAGDRPARPHR